MHSPTLARLRWSAKSFTMFARGARSAAFSTALFVAVASAAATAAFAQGGRLDQALVKSPRDGSLNAVYGTVKQYELGKVVIEVAGKDVTYDSNRVPRIVSWGDAPAPLHDGVRSLAAGAFEDAVKAFRSASSSAQRDIVKASAKAMTADALWRWGASDATRFTEAVAECESFAASFATHRDLPFVQQVHARALWLSGKPAEAGAAFKSIYAKLSGDKVADGYDADECMRAGLSAARALLDAKDTLGAREIYAGLESSVGPLVAGLAADDARKPVLQAVLDEAMLGAGYVDLAAGQSKQALTFFQNKVNGLNANSPLSTRNSAMLGLGEALLAEGKFRDASLQLAKVAALEAADIDRAARATVKLAEAYSKLTDADSRQQACARVKDVISRFGLAPASVRARQLAKELGC